LAHHAAKAMKPISKQRRMIFSTCAIVRDAGSPGS
jgi:hypothetical protein